MKVGDLVKIMACGSGHEGKIALVMGYYFSPDCFNIQIVGESKVRPYHITRLMKICK